VTWRHASERDLAAAVVADAGQPADPLHVAAALEGLGLRDRDVQERFGASDVFELASVVFRHCRILADQAPELTVAMPARNTGRFIASAIESVLAQQGVDFELVVVVDASTDDTAAVARSFDDHRVRVLSNATPRGIAYSHNRVIAESRAPFIAHVDSDDRVLPGAFTALLAALRESPDIGQAHCQGFRVDSRARVSRDWMRVQRSRMRSRPRSHHEYRRDLLVHGSVMNHLRMYRREVFDAVGPFEETLRYGVDYEMALRLVEKYRITGVPRLLYAVRESGASTTQNLRFGRLRFWAQRLRISTRLVRRREISFPRWGAYRLDRLMLRGLVNALTSRPKATLRRARATVRARVSRLRRRILHRAGRVVYAGARAGLRWWPSELRSRRPRGGERVAYFLWRFPALSHSFLRREIQALLDAGTAVSIFAEEPGDLASGPGAVAELAARTTHLMPLDRVELRRCRNDFLRRRPLATARAFLHVIAHQHGRFKSFAEDKAVFSRALRLAALCEEAGVDRIHAPWADRCAFVALVAAYLAGVPYSVQARAHELFRDSGRFALREKFRSADFVVTNAEYTQPFVREAARSDDVPVRTIYEGVDPRRFDPSPTPPPPLGPLRILSVARLVEEKGLVHLLEACRILRDRGVELECTQIGGPEEPQYTNYRLEVARLRRRLRLENHVTLAGRKLPEDVTRALGEADVFVLPCVVAGNAGRDVSPNSIIEAMAMKLPVISTRISGIPELVEDGVSGILVRPGDPVELADALAQLASDPALRRKLGECGRERVERLFDVTRNVERYRELFAAPPRRSGRGAHGAC
jgi:glycosyltransferase involved in cell wall biosynthesis